MKLRTLGCAAALSMLAYAPARGAVIISEVVYNEVGSAATGEWIEIYNNGASAVDLSNYKIGDEETSGGTSTTEALFQFPSGASIAPGQVQIISGDADAFFTIYGFLPTYETAGANVSVPNLTTYATWDPDGGVLNMSNTNDQAVLIGPDDTRVDAVGWGNTNAFNPGLDPDAEGDGQSYERINANIDTDTAADWQLGPASTVAAERSTPGVVAVPEPGAFGLALIGGALAVRRSRRRE